MKKTVLFLAALTLAVASSEAKDKKNKKAGAAIVPVKVMANDVDSMSYALGINVGEKLGKDLKTLPEGKYNLDLFVSSFVGALKGDTTLLMKSDFVKDYLNKYFQAAQARDMAKKQLENQQFLATNMTKEGVKTTASGLQYQVLVPAEGPKPKETDTVKVHYTGTLIDGTKFDSSVDRGEPAVFPLNHVIKGWSEGVQLMPVGSKYKFVIPSDLAYGEQGAGQIIAPFSTLVFEVELLEIKPFKEKAPVVETKVAEPAKKAAKAAPAAKKAKK